MGRPIGSILREPQAGSSIPEMRRLYLHGHNMSEIARKLGLSRVAVSRSIKRWQARPWWRKVDAENGRANKPAHVVVEDDGDDDGFDPAPKRTKRYTEDEVRAIVTDTLGTLLREAKTNEAKEAIKAKVRRANIHPVGVRAREERPRAGSMAPFIRNLMRKGVSCAEAGRILGLSHSAAQKHHARWHWTKWWKSKDF